MDMSQYRDLFFSETREHLNHLSTLVVALEQNPGTRATVDALFREAHSIKGMAATMGFEQTAHLAHSLEDMLDKCRTTGDVSAKQIDTLLAGIDLFEELLEDLSAHRPERTIEKFLRQATSGEEAGSTARFAGLAPSEEGEDEFLPLLALEIDDEDPRPAADPAEDLPGSVDPAAPVEVVAVVALEESDVFQIVIDLEEDTPATAARCLLILRELSKAGDLMTSRPSMDILRSGAPCRQLQAWLRTSLVKEHLAGTLQRISGVASVRFISDRRREDRRGREDVGRTVRIRTELLDKFINLTGEMLTQRHRLKTAGTRRDWPEMNRALEQAGRLIDDLHHHVLQARLMPFESITGRLPRIVRDLSRKTGKHVVLKLIGTDVGSDRAVLEELTDPLVHLVRNAVDHGIVKEGTVTVSASREQDLVLIEVADDGQGMDPARLRSKAVERGLLSEAQSAAISDHDALMLICHPGFSTAAQITETSGRGVGMDVVKSAVGNLGGTLEIISSLGMGSRFQMRLPLSVAIIRILLVTCAGRTLAIPLTRVLRALDLPASKIESRGGKRFFRYAEENVQLYSLAEILGLPQPSSTAVVWTVLTESGGRRIGLQVDALLGHRKAFVKTLNFPLNQLTGLSGATIEGDGHVVFIIDPQSLLDGWQELATE